MISKSKIHSKVQELLEDCNIRTAPINLVKIAKKLNIHIEYVDFENDIDGLLIKKADTVILGVNKNKPDRRKRFTIAHEIGHYVLHMTRPIFVDDLVVKFRNSASSEGFDIEEKEANTFAAELLMPEELVRERMAEVVDIEGEIQKIAEDDFDVSIQSFIYRLNNLNYEVNF